MATDLRLLPAGAASFSALFGGMVHTSKDVEYAFSLPEDDVPLDSMKAAYESMVVLNHAGIIVGYVKSFARDKDQVRVTVSFLASIPAYIGAILSKGDRPAFIPMEYGPVPLYIFCDPPETHNYKIADTEIKLEYVEGCKDDASLDAIVDTPKLFSRLPVFRVVVYKGEYYATTVIGYAFNLKADVSEGRVASLSAHLVYWQEPGNLEVAMTTTTSEIVSSNNVHYDNHVHRYPLLFCAVKIAKPPKHAIRISGRRTHNVTLQDL